MVLENLGRRSEPVHQRPDDDTLGATPTKSAERSERVPPKGETAEGLREEFKEKAGKYEQFYTKLHNEAWEYFLPEGTLKSVLAATRYGADEGKRYDKMIRAQTWEAVRFAKALNALNEQYKEKQRSLGVQNPEELPTQLPSILESGERALADNYFGEDNEGLKRKSAWDEL